MESSAVYTDTQVVGIWDCANRCSESFQQCLIAASTIHPKLHCAVEDQLAKFSTWNAGMGIFTLERGCIHRRLRDVPEVQAVVRGLLESLDHQIQTCKFCRALARMIFFSKSDTEPIERSETSKEAINHI